MNLKLDQLLMQVAAYWNFDDENYPALKDKSHEQILIFTLLHILLHNQKSMGEISSILENYDHELIIDPNHFAILRQLAHKLIINNLRMAAALEISAEEIVQYIDDWGRIKETKRTLIPT